MKRYKTILKEALDEKQYLKLLDKTAKIIRMKYGKYPESKVYSLYAHDLLKSYSELSSFITKNYNIPARLITLYIIDDLTDTLKSYI
jgi:hypothetical protein